MVHASAIKLFIKQIWITIRTTVEVKKAQYVFKLYEMSLYFLFLKTTRILLLFPETTLAPSSLRFDHIVTMSWNADKVIWRWHDCGLGHKVVIQIREGSYENAVMEHISVQGVYGIKLKETHKITNHLPNSWDLLHFILSHMLLPCALLLLFVILHLHDVRTPLDLPLQTFPSVDSLRLSDTYMSQ